MMTDPIADMLTRIRNAALARHERAEMPHSNLKEQIIFPEINYDRIDVIKGMNISFVTTARTDEEGRALLAKLGMPFRAATAAA